VVIDEISMLDVELAAMLLEAAPPATRIVLVGDADQLP
jgi:exodeoxyribonuclease V alpha subunit